MAKAIHSMIRALEEDRSTAFYKTAFDLTVAERLDFETFTLVYMSNPESEFEIELTINKGRAEPYALGDGYGHLAVSVSDLDAEHARLEAAGLAPAKIGRISSRWRTYRALLLHHRSGRLQDRGPAASRPVQIIAGRPEDGRPAKQAPATAGKPSAWRRKIMTTLYENTPGLSRRQFLKRGTVGAVLVISGTAVICPRGRVGHGGNRAQTRNHGDAD